MQELRNRIETALGQVIVEYGKFGHQKRNSFWVLEQDAASVLKYMVHGLEQAAPVLENFSIVKIDDALIISYFVTNMRQSENYVVRFSRDIIKGKTLKLRSMRDVFPQIHILENENEQCFDIKFIGESEK